MKPWSALRTCAKRCSSKMERHNLIETRIREMIEEGTLLVDVSGQRVGQVNGLSVLEIGGYAFGKPVRITATAALGKAGLINIEREANLSGRFHDKGMHIIAGYLRSNFRAGQAAFACGEHLLRAILLRSGRRQRQLHRNVCAGFGALRICRCGRTSP